VTCLKIFESFFKINHSQALLKIKLSDGSGEKYKNNAPDSEEEIWIPIKKRI